MIKPSLFFQKLKPFKKNSFFENQSWQPGSGVEDFSFISYQNRDSFGVFNAVNQRTVYFWFKACSRWSKWMQLSFQCLFLFNRPVTSLPFDQKVKKWVTLNQKLLILPRFMTKRFLDFAPALGKTLPQQTLVPILGDFAFAVFFLYSDWIIW